MTLKNIRQLRAILNDSLDTLEKLYEGNSLDFPSLDKAYFHDEAETLASHPIAIEAVTLTISAAYQLINTVRSPFGTLSDAASVVSMLAGVSQ